MAHGPGSCSYSEFRDSKTAAALGSSFIFLIVFAYVRLQVSEGHRHVFLILLTVTVSKRVFKSGSVIP